MLRTYARIVAVALFAAALTGWLVPRWRADEVVFHAGLALLYIFVGFWPSLSAGTVRQMVGGLGVLLVVVKAIMILGPLMWGSHLMHGATEITCLVVGIISIVASRYLPDEIRSDRAEEHPEEALEVRHGAPSAAEDQDHDPGDDRQQE